MLPEDAVIVPGHGEPVPVGQIEHSIRYLEALMAKVDSLVTEDATIALTEAGAELPEFAEYTMYSVVHRRINVPAALEALTSPAPDRR